MQRRDFMKAGMLCTASAYVPAGYPLPGRIRQALFVLPKSTAWQGLRLKAEIEVNGQRHAVRWACHQKPNEDGSLTLRPTEGLNVSNETGGLGA
jgi:hypothetical protein